MSNTTNTIFEVQDQDGDCFSRHHREFTAKLSMDKHRETQAVEANRLKMQISELQTELRTIEDESLRVVEVEATEQRLTWMKNCEDDGLNAS